MKISLYKRIKIAILKRTLWPIQYYLWNKRQTDSREDLNSSGW